MTNEKLSLLHDHYKETFSLIRAREGQRDKLFLWLLVLFGILVIEVQYPANVHGVLGSVTVAGNTVNLNLVPLNLLLDVSWASLAAFVLKYCQTAKAVDRQYPYLHLIEDRVSAALSDDHVYRREGRVYLSRYPRLLNWAWLLYTIVFPTAMIFAVVYLYSVEVRELKRSWLALAFDGAFALTVVLTVFVYRYFPGDSGPTEARTGQDSYLDQAAAAIRAELHENPRDATPPQLMRLYAVLLRVKGAQVTAEDVHDAWSAWMAESQPQHPDIRPFSKLDGATRAADEPFVQAIRSAARVVGNELEEGNEANPA